MHSAPRHLVLVDDDPHVLNALRFAFEAEGYAVTSHDSGESVLSAPPENKNACLVIDERLPGLSGLEAISRLRAMGVMTPAILVTSNPSARTVARAAAVRVDIVEKPLLGDVLAAKVRAVFAT